MRKGISRGIQIASLILVVAGTLPANADDVVYRPAIVLPDTGIELVFVPGGEFMMGAEGGGKDNGDIVKCC